MRVVSAVGAFLLVCAGSLTACGAVIGLPGSYYVADGGTEPGPNPADGHAGEGALGDGENNGNRDGPCTTDPQKDPLNCGVCGHDCLGSDCIGGYCQPVLLTQTSYAGSATPPIALDDEYVYYFDDMGLERIAKSGGSPSAVAPNQFGNALATDGSYVYWITPTPSPALAYRVATDGGNLEPITSTDGGTGPYGWDIALDSAGGIAYLLVDSSLATQQILRCAANGGGCTAIAAANYPGGAPSGDTPPRLTVVQSTPYWTDGSLAPLGCGAGCDGGPAPGVATTGGDMSFPLTSWGEWLVWASATDGGVFGCTIQPAGGQCAGSPTSLCNVTQVRDLAADETTAYVVGAVDASSAPGIVSCPLGTSTHTATVVLAPTTTLSAASLAVDSTSIYFFGTAGGAFDLYRIAK